MFLATLVQGDNPHTTVHLVDLATGVCTPQPDLLHSRNSFAVARWGCLFFTSVELCLFFTSVRPPLDPVTPHRLNTPGLVSTLEPMK
jgi:hypothetical protein